MLNVCKKCGNEFIKPRCMHCAKIYQQKYYLLNIEKIKSYNSNYQFNNPENRKQRQNKWINSNPGIQAKKQKEYRERNPEKAGIYQKERHLSFPEIYSELSAKRRSLKKQATPLWGNQFFIKEIYHLAKLRTKLFGFKWHVDHVVPINSKFVCGLHVEHNLQVIPAIDNILKSNKFWPEMPI